MINEPGLFERMVQGLLVVVPILAGLGFFAAALRNWRRRRRLTGTGVRAVAVVVDNQQGAGGDHDTVFRPVVEFPTVAGDQRRVVLEDAAAGRSHLVGSEIAVWYDPAAPDAVVSGGKSTGALAVSSVVALVFIGFGFLAHHLIAAAGTF